MLPRYWQTDSCSLHVVQIFLLRILGHPLELAFSGTKRNVNFSMHQTLVTFYLLDHHMLMAASGRVVKVACQQFPQRPSIPHWARHFVIHQISENPLPKKCWQQGIKPAWSCCRQNRITWKFLKPSSWYVNKIEFMNRAFVFWKSQISATWVFYLIAE